MNLNEWKKKNLPPVNALGTYESQLTKRHWSELKRACLSAMNEIKQKAIQTQGKNIWEDDAWEWMSLNNQIKECDKHL